MVYNLSLFVLVQLLSKLTFVLHCSCCWFKISSFSQAVVTANELIGAVIEDVVGANAVIGASEVSRTCAGDIHREIGEIHAVASSLAQSILLDSVTAASAQFKAAAVSSGKRNLGPAADA